jgi:transcriptional regulator GlxA family with amidase domain
VQRIEPRGIVESAEETSTGRNRTLQVFVIGIDGADSLNTVSVLDTMAKANAAWRYLMDPGSPDLFIPITVAIDRAPIRFANGVSLDPMKVVGEDDQPNLVVVPGLDVDVPASLELNRHWVKWIRHWHDRGSVVASSCTGAFLVAEAGILDGRQATTHWVAKDLFLARYPKVELAIERIVVDEGDVITSGGATTAFNLVLYLVSRFGTPDRARVLAKMLLLDSGRDSQLPFAMVGLHRQHADRMVHDAQSAIQQKLINPLTVAAVADFVGVSTRTLNRRFQTAIGISPRSYIEQVRVESAKRLLEQTTRTVDLIRSDLGFLDPTAFHRAFKRVAGVSPSEYRRRFGLREPTPLP